MYKLPSTTPPISSYLSTLLFFISFLTRTHSETFFSEPSVQEFSGSNFGSSTGWIYEPTINSAQQWGRLYYRMDPIASGGDNYVHVTFVAIENGEGLYEYTDGTTTETSQTLRIVDSVGSTALMASSPDQSVQYLLNIDTGTSDGELNVDTQYIYYYNSNWTCLEWYTDFEQQDIQLYENSILTYEVDNGIIFTGPSTGATITFTFDQSLNLGIGMYTYNGVSVSGHIKGIEIGDERIGCGNNNGNSNTDSSDDGNGGGGNGGNKENNNNGESTGQAMIAVTIVLVIVLVIVGLGIVVKKKQEKDMSENSMNEQLGSTTNNSMPQGIEIVKTGETNGV